MIHLTKEPEPAVLAANAVHWTATILNKIANAEPVTDYNKTHYRHADIKAALVAETSGKCAYCESKLLHIHHGDVEHIFPKSLDVLRTFDWSNLTLACEICNQNKSNLDPTLAFIIDPYVVDPSQHLTFAGALMVAKGDGPGTATRAILDLNRGDLAERRKERLEALATIMEIVFRPNLPIPVRQAMYDNLKRVDAVKDAAYSAMAVAFINTMAPHLPAGIVP